MKAHFELVSTSRVLDRESSVLDLKDWNLDRFVYGVDGETLVKVSFPGKGVTRAIWEWNNLWFVVLMYDEIDGHVKPLDCYDEEFAPYWSIESGYTDTFDVPQWISPADWYEAEADEKDSFANVLFTILDGVGPLDDILEAVMTGEYAWAIQTLNGFHAAELLVVPARGGIL